MYSRCRIASRPALRSSAVRTFFSVFTDCAFGFVIGVLGFETTLERGEATTFSFTAVSLFEKSKKNVATSVIRTVRPQRIKLRFDFPHRISLTLDCSILIGRIPLPSRILKSCVRFSASTNMCACRLFLSLYIMVGNL